MIILPISIPILERLTQQGEAGNFEVITEIGPFVSSVMSVILTVSALVTFLYLGWGGLNWIMAGGDKTKIEEARNRITNALIGLVVVAASWAIFSFINWYLGLNVIGEGTSSPTNTAPSSNFGGGGASNQPPLRIQ